jgi:hypothetical protein
MGSGSSSEISSSGAPGQLKGERSGSGEVFDCGERDAIATSRTNQDQRASRPEAARPRGTLNT